MDAFRSAEAAGLAAKCPVLEQDELQEIWQRICLAEYIAPHGNIIDIQKPAMITCEVMDCFKKHPYQNTLIDDQAKETSDEGLQRELATAEASSLAKERSMRPRSRPAGLQRRRLAALAKGELVLFSLRDSFFPLY